MIWVDGLFLIVVIKIIDKIINNFEILAFKNSRTVD